MTRKIFYFIFFISFVFSLYGCKSLYLDENVSLNVCFCVDSLGLGDKVFNSNIIESFNEINLDDNYKFLIKECENKESYFENIKSAAENCDIIFCSYLMNDEVIKLSKEYKDKFFILLNGIVSDRENNPVIADNLISCIFSESDKATIAGEKTGEFLKEGGKAGIISVSDKYSPNIRLIIDSFKKGVSKNNKNCEIDYKFLSNANDFDQGLKLYNELINEGCKIIYLCDGSYVTSILDSVESNKTSLIIGGDFKDLIKPNVFGVIEKDYKVVIKEIISDFENEKLAGGVKIFGIDSSSIKFKYNEGFILN